jgi:hypothetical protein
MIRVMATQIEAPASATAAPAEQQRRVAVPDIPPAAAVGTSAWLDDASAAEPWSASSPLPSGRCACPGPDPDGIGLCGSCGLEVGWRPRARRD